MTTKPHYKDVFSKMEHCRRCRLRDNAKQVVVGSGNPKKAIAMLIGEAPGRTENELGDPFVGKSGQFMFEIFEKFRLPRKLFYVTNIVKCQPPDNRDPHPDEIAACKPHLDFQIKTVKPLLYVPVGRFALKHFDASVKLTYVHGTLMESKGVKIFPLYHPAYILRNFNARVQFEADVVELRKTLRRLYKETKNKKMFGVRR